MISKIKPFYVSLAKLVKFKKLIVCVDQYQIRRPGIFAFKSFLLTSPPVSCRTKKNPGMRDMNLWPNRKLFGDLLVCLLFQLHQKEFWDNIVADFELNPESPTRENSSPIVRPIYGLYFTAFPAGFLFFKFLINFLSYSAWCHLSRASTVYGV